MKQLVFYCEYTNRIVLFNGHFYVSYNEDNKKHEYDFFQQGTHLKYIGVL